MTVVTNYNANFLKKQCQRVMTALDSFLFVVALSCDNHVVNRLVRFKAI